MKLIQQDVSLDPQQYVPAVVSAVTTVVLFIVVFVVIYLLGKYFATERPNAASGGGSSTRRSSGWWSARLSWSPPSWQSRSPATVAGFGVVLAAFATLAGVLALAVGFAAQDLIANFVAGVFIIQDEPFTVGDWVEWNGNSGVVRDVQLRVTKLDTFDNS